MNESIGITQLSAVVKSAGHKCDLLLLSHSKDINKDIKEFKPDLMGFTCMTGSHSRLLKVISDIKHEFPLVPNIIGGPHPTYYPEVIQNNNVDMICRGEGEGAILDLLNRMHNKEHVSDILNLWVKKDGKIIENDIRPLIHDLDSLPLPDRGIYYKYDFLKNVSMKRFVSSRGCPFLCTFCYNTELKRLYRNKGKYVRWKSVDRLIEEVMHVKNNSRLKLVTFSDDNMLLDRKWLRDFSSKFPKTVGLPFNCSARFDRIDKEIAACLKNAGCFAVALGLESGSERVRNELLKKSLSNREVIEGARVLKDHGIKILTTNILGSPTETINEVYETIEINHAIKADFGRAFPLLAFPNLEITKLAQSEGLLPSNYSVDNCDTGLREVISENKHKTQIKNLISVFYIAIKFPIMWPIIKLISKFPFNFLFKPLELLSVYQEMRFFKVDVFSGFNFFINTLQGTRGLLFGQRKYDKTN